MTTDMIKKLLDACFLAKKITELMPKLPKGLKPRHIHVIACIAEWEENKGAICVSDVSKILKITTPSVTKLLSELESLRIIMKDSGQEDKRVISLSLTELGVSYYQTYVVNYHGCLMSRLSTMDKKDCETTIHTIEQLYEMADQLAKEGLDE